MKFKKGLFLYLSITLSGNVLAGVLVTFKSIEYGFSYMFPIILTLLIFVWLDVLCIKKYKSYKSEDTSTMDSKNNIEPKDSSTENNQLEISNNINSKIKSSRLFGCLIPIVCIVGFFIVVVSNIDTAVETTNIPESITKIIKVGIEDKDTATNIDKILQECDIQLTEIVHDELLDNAHGVDDKGYRVASNGINNIILYLNSDNTVYSIKYAGNYLYKNNEVISKLTDYYFTMEEQNSLQINAQKMVKSILKSPSTAKFPSIVEWKFYKDKDKVIIQSYVDSQNSFGAMLRSEFQITLTPDKKEITSFIFDGKEYIN